MDKAIRLREPTAGYLEYIADNLRAADLAELQAVHGEFVDPRRLLSHAARVSTLCKVALVEAEPAAVFGVAPISLLGDLGIPWMLGTDLMFKYPGSLIKGTRRYIPVMRSMYAELVNYVDARNTRSIRFLRGAGFSLEEPLPFGAQGLPFHRFEMKG